MPNLVCHRVSALVSLAGVGIIVISKHVRLIVARMAFVKKQKNHCLEQEVLVSPQLHHLRLKILLDWKNLTAAQQKMKITLIVNMKTDSGRLSKNNSGTAAQKSPEGVYQDFTKVRSVRYDVRFFESSKHTE